jgi:glycosyltransferase involved in cell wall biosynthesis/GT2 family glycosyltransferase
MAESLTWSLVVATFNRAKVLRRCLELATQQTRPPVEIIVVDASPDWATTREQILRELAVDHPHIRWEYVQAQRRSGTVQRNQGIRLARGDVLFLIDDDSLMYTDCAEQVLRFYDADVDQQVAGVMADEALAPPDAPAPVEKPSAPPPALSRLRQFKDRLLQQLGVLDYLLPYDARRPTRPLPPAVRHLNSLPRERLYGAWMTVRRSAIEQEPFDEILDAYSYLEDSDVSYRLARHGLLLLARDAKICHLRDPGGRLSLLTLGILGTLNALVLHRLHSSDLRRSISLYRSFLVKQLAVQGLRDLASRDLTFPRARGVLVAMRLFRKVFTSSEADLREWYPAYQEELFRRDPRSRGGGIGYLVPEFPSQTHAFFWREVLALRQAGVSVHLVSSRRPEANACRHAFAAPAAAETYYLFPPRPLGALGVLLTRPLRTLQALRYVLRLRESPWKKRLKYGGLLLCAADLLAHARRHGYRHLHVHSCADTAHVAALCRILGGPTYSLTLHGDLPVYGTDHASKMAAASLVACVTKPLRKQVLETVRLPAERTDVLWMGVDTDAFRCEDGRAYESNRLHIVTVARLNAMKGHRHALAAMRQAIDRGCDIRYTIAGEGPYRPEIEAAIRDLRLADRVDLAGTLSESAVHALLQRADAFVLPSVGLGEAAPVSVMEAMACGLPVVASIIGGTPDMITHGVDGLLIPQADEQALTDALVLLANHPEERRRLGQAARSRAVSCFDSRQTSQRLLAAIQARTN